MDKTNSKSAVDQANKSRAEFADELNSETVQKSKQGGSTNEKK